ncbi:unnamed protein product [Prorocentrum cordatum]|uniref:EamA domain-containing protein n=1 Tax=Prorocentrum cordatum TaxID=2364126 RepID=A0ABN9WNH9_9DINO|nr:unnamed protein product [Polarella glacialis]
MPLPRLRAMFFAVTLLPLVEVIALTFTMPLWGALFGRLFLGEPLPRVLAVALPACAAGVVLITEPWSPNGADAFPRRGLGAAVALCHAALSAAAKTCVRALGKGGHHPQVIVLYLTLCGSAISASVLFGLQGGPVAPLPRQWALLCATGACAFGSQTFSTLALRDISVGEAAVVNYLSLVWRASCTASWRSRRRPASTEQLVV